MLMENIDFTLATYHNVDAAFFNTLAYYKLTKNGYAKMALPAYFLRSILKKLATNPFS